jgi:hypothetical protein
MNFFDEEKYNIKKMKEILRDTEVTHKRCSINENNHGYA